MAWKIAEGWSEVILSLGSNQGDRSAWLAFAARVVSSHPRVRTLALSPVYKTEPVDVPEAYAKAFYFNQILVCETDLVPEKFSEFVHRIEHDAGRQRGDTLNLPRTLDIDIVCFGKVVMKTPELELPHPRALSRRFVLQPLSDVMPDFIFPGDSQTVSQRLSRLPPKPETLLVDDRLLLAKESGKWNYPF